MQAGHKGKIGQPTKGIHGPNRGLNRALNRALIGPYRALYRALYRGYITPYRVELGPVGPGPLPKRLVANILFFFPGFAHVPQKKNTKKRSKKVRKGPKTSTGPKTDFLGRKT